MKKIACTLLSLSLSGCIFPVPPTYERKQLIDAGASQTVKAVSLQDARQLAVAWTQKLRTASVERRNTAIGANEVLFYGTLLTVLGSAAIAQQAATGVTSIAMKARNIGAGVGIGATLFNNHYELRNQHLIFKRAAERMQCASDALAPIDPVVREGFVGEFNKETFIDPAKKNIDPAKEDTEPQKSLAGAFDEVPRQMIDFIENQSMMDLEAALNAVALATSSKEEIAAVLNNLSNAQSIGARSAKKMVPSQVEANRVSADTELYRRNAENAKRDAITSEEAMHTLQRKADADREVIKAKLAAEAGRTKVAALTTAVNEAQAPANTAATPAPSRQQPGTVSELKKRLSKAEDELRGAERKVDSLASVKNQKKAADTADEKNKAAETAEKIATASEKKMADVVEIKRASATQIDNQRRFITAIIAFPSALSACRVLNSH